MLKQEDVRVVDWIQLAEDRVLFCEHDKIVGPMKMGFVTNWVTITSSGWTLDGN